MEEKHEKECEEEEKKKCEEEQKQKKRQRDSVESIASAGPSVVMTGSSTLQ